MKALMKILSLLAVLATVTSAGFISAYSDGPYLNSNSAGDVGPGTYYYEITGGGLVQWFDANGDNQISGNGSGTFACPGGHPLYGGYYYAEVQAYGWYGTSYLSLTW